MNGTMLTMTAAAFLATAAITTGGPQAQARPAPATADLTCKQAYAHFLHRLTVRPRPEYMKQRYESLLGAAYQRCRADGSTAWDRIENILS